MRGAKQRSNLKDVKEIATSALLEPPRNDIKRYDKLVIMQNNNIYRIIDANINRASEALRVLEDWARFVKNSIAISEKLKNIRHNINNLISLHPNLILNRDSEYDTGKSIENKSTRSSAKDIIRANCKRTEEALRVLCEYGQLLNIDIKAFEQNRYDIYSLEKELIRNEKLLRLQNASLYFVAGRDIPAGRLNNANFLSIVEKSIEGGIDIIQLREKNTPEKDIIDLGKEIKKLINKTDVVFIVNDRIDIALACEADGVHLGQDDLPVNEARTITPDGFIIGLSTHSPEQGKIALNTNADYFGIGPVFPTPTKPDYKAAGLEYVTWAATNIKDLPWFAIGGISEENIDKITKAGAKKIAVVRAIMTAKDPLKITQLLKEKITGNIKEYAKSR